MSGSAPANKASVVLARGRGRLAEAGTASPDAEARTLLAHVVGVPLSRLVLLDQIADADARAFDAAIERRAAGEPVQHITGVAAFRTVEVAVGPGVFVPRPETEVMTGWALQRLAGLERIWGVDDPVVVELCAGSGAISLAIATEWRRARVHAVELSEEAAAWAAKNLAGTGVDLRVGDMADAFTELDGRVDLVIANPPYIPLEAWESVPLDVRDHDPALALWSGDDGLDATRVVARVAARLLSPGGWVGCEHAEVQAESAPQVFVDTGAFDRVWDEPDLALRPRFVVAERGAGPAAAR